MKKTSNVKRHLKICQKKYGIVGNKGESRIQKELEALLELKVMKNDAGGLDDEDNDIDDLVDLCNSVVWIPVSELNTFFEA